MPSGVYKRKSPMKMAKMHRAERKMRWIRLTYSHEGNAKLFVINMPANAFEATMTRLDGILVVNIERMIGPNRKFALV